MTSCPALLRILVALAVIGYVYAQRSGGRPSIVTQPQTFNVRAGDSVTLPCEVNNMGRRSLFWFKGEDRRNRELLLQVKYVRGRPVVPASFVSRYLNTGKYALNGTGLQLPKVEPLDAGEYTCSVSFVRQFVKHKLVVYDDAEDDDFYDEYGFDYDDEEEEDAWGEEDEEEEEDRGRQEPRWRKEDFGIDAFPENGEAVASEDSDVTLTCRVRGYQTDPIWYHRGRQVAQGSVLELLNVHHSQAGEYECRVRNQQFEDHYTFRVHVLYLTVEAEKAVVEAPSNGPAELACVVSGSQPAQVEWFHEGELLRPDGVTLRQVAEGPRLLLQISEVSSRDVGNYDCRVYSDVGRSSAQLSLFPLPSATMSFYSRSIPPQVPGKVREQIFFEFNSVEPLQGVEVYYTKANSDEGWVRIDLGPDRVVRMSDQSFRADYEIDLDPDSDYYIQAKAFTDTGRYSPNETPRSFRTPPIEEVYESQTSPPYYYEETYENEPLVQGEYTRLPKWLRTSLLLTSRLPILYRIFGN